MAGLVASTVAIVRREGGWIIVARDGKQLDVLVAHFATVGEGGFERNWFLPSDVAAWNRFFR